MNKKIKKLLNNIEKKHGKGSIMVMNEKNIKKNIDVYKTGHKMSKSKGNTINPFTLIKKFGIDPIRWYLINNSRPSKNIKFDQNSIISIQNKFFNTLYNIHMFLYNYSKIDKIKYKKVLSFKKQIILKDIDNWIISRLNNLLIRVNKYYKMFYFTHITRVINNFLVNDLSNWYIRLSRSRFWQNKYNNNKASAYYTLYISLYSVLKITHPIIPFVSEYIYKRLYNNKNSILLEKYCMGNKKKINKNIEFHMHHIRKYVKIILYLRKKKILKLDSH